VQKKEDDKQQRAEPTWLKTKPKLRLTAKNKRRKKEKELSERPRRAGE